MSAKRMLAAVLAPLLAGSSSPAISIAANPVHPWVAQCSDWDEWDKAGPPFRILANNWYVGTCGIAAILLTGDEGHILIDGGPASAAPLIARNIEALGFKLADVKILLMSHEHHDHIGAMAELQRMTGARLLVSPAAAAAMSSGAAVPDDPQFGEHATFPPARVDGLVSDGDTVKLGEIELRALATPGHTPGALSWYWNVWFDADDDPRSTMVYADSLTPVSSDGHRFSDHPQYLASYRESLAKIAGLGCRLLLSPHPSASGMRDIIVDRGRFAAKPTACVNYAAGLTKQLDERIAREAEGP